jgi:hypothetical protein
VFGSANPLAGNAFAQFLQPLDQESLQSAFQKGVVDPTMQTYNQQVIPGIQQRFVDANASSSSALNQALSQSAKDLSTSLGGQYLNFMQGQQQNTLGALGQLGGLAGQRTFSPIVSQQGGILGPLIAALGQIGAGYAMSSEAVKENIRDYDRGLDVIEQLEVKQYDYKPEVGGGKNRVGVIAEDLPAELTADIKGIKAADVYGLVGTLINAVKELSARLEAVEARHDDPGF